MENQTDNRRIANPEPASFGPDLRFHFFEILKIVHYPFGFKMPRPSVFAQGGLDETEPTSAISGWALTLEEFGVGNGSALIFYSVVDMVQKMVTDL